MYDAVVGLPIQPTTAGRPAAPLPEKAPSLGTKRVVSTTVGITVTASVNWRAYDAR